MTNEAFERIQQIIKERNITSYDIEHYEEMLYYVNEKCKNPGFDNSLYVIIPTETRPDGAKYWVKYEHFKEFLENEIVALQAELAKLDAEVASM